MPFVQIIVLPPTVESSSESITDAVHDEKIAATDYAKDEKVEVDDEKHAVANNLKDLDKTEGRRADRN